MLSLLRYMKKPSQRPAVSETRGKQSYSGVFSAFMWPLSSAAASDFSHVKPLSSRVQLNTPTVTAITFLQTLAAGNLVLPGEVGSLVVVEIPVLYG